MDKKIVLLRILYVTLAISMILVWGQSCINKTESRESSDAIVEMIKPIDQLEEGYRSPNGMTYVELSTYVRKAAHVIEYAAVGFQIMAILLLKKKKELKVAINVLFLGGLIGLVDETIQIFSERGSEVGDIWIDMAGILVGILGARFIGWIVEKRLKKKIKA